MIGSAYRRAKSPDPATAAGMIAGFVEGIALAFINKIVAVIFRQLAAVQQSLNPETTLVDLGTIFTAWGLVHFLFAYVVPVVASYAWAGNVGVTVYSISWLGTTIFLNGGFTLDVVLLIAASFFVVIVDMTKIAVESNSCHTPRRPPI